MIAKPSFPELQRGLSASCDMALCLPMSPYGGAVSNIFDISPNKVSVVSVSGASWDGGPYGPALKFDGSSGQGVNLGVVPALNWTEGSFEFVVRLNTGSMTGSIGGLGTAVFGNYSETNGYSFLTQTDGGMSLSTWINGVQSVAYLGAGSFVANTWVTVVGSVSGGGDYKFWFSTSNYNEAYVGAIALPGDTQSPFFVGNGLAGVVYGDFSIAELRIYRRETPMFTSPQIASRELSGLQ